MTFYIHYTAAISPLFKMVTEIRQVKGSGRHNTPAPQSAASLPGDKIYDSHHWGHKRSLPYKLDKDKYRVDNM